VTNFLRREGLFFSHFLEVSAMIAWLCYLYSYGEVECHGEKCVIEGDAHLMSARKQRERQGGEWPKNPSRAHFQ
jgi:hypothetical protein